MTVSELIEELRAMPPPDAPVMLWSRMDDPHHRRVQRVELSTTKSDPTAVDRQSPRTTEPNTDASWIACAFAMEARGTWIRFAR
jgi:hypothetical protein